MPEEGRGATCSSSIGTALSTSLALWAAVTRPARSPRGELCLPRFRTCFVQIMGELLQVRMGTEDARARAPQAGETSSFGVVNCRGVESAETNSGVVAGGMSCSGPGRGPLAN